MPKTKWLVVYKCATCTLEYDSTNDHENQQSACPKCGVQNSPLTVVSTWN